MWWWEKTAVLVEWGFRESSPKWWSEGCGEGFFFSGSGARVKVCAGMRGSEEPHGTCFDMWSHPFILDRSGEILRSVSSSRRMVQVQLAQPLIIYIPAATR